MAHPIGQVQRCKLHDEPAIIAQMTIESKDNPDA
jgi:hypothetical protein